MVVVSQLEFFVAPVLLPSLFHLVLQLTKRLLCRFEAHISRNLSPELVGSIFQGMVPDRLFATLFIKNFLWMVANLLSIVEFVVSYSCFDFVHVRSIFV